MKKIIACLDASEYADRVCRLSVWASERTGCPISLLHVAIPHSDAAPKADLSGAIGIDTNSELLKALTEVDEAHGKLEQRKGQSILEHGRQELVCKGIKHAEIIHRRGALVDIILELKNNAALIVMGKRGENEGSKSTYLGSNLEKIARALDKPLLVAVKDARTINRFLIAYDGSPSSQRAVDYAIKSPLLKGIECHLLKVAEIITHEAKSTLTQGEQELKDAGLIVRATLKQGKHVHDIISAYVAENGIDLLVMGAYGHSKIRSMFLGSTTTTLIQNTHIPLLLLR